jgi:hypothetical protein
VKHIGKMTLIRGSSAVRLIPQLHPMGSLPRITVGVGAALLFEGGAAGFSLEAALFGGCGGLGRATRRGGNGSAAEQFDKAIECILPVPFLCPKATRHDHEDAILGQASAGKTGQPPLDFGGKPSDISERKAQLYGACDFVDILPAGAGSADEIFHDPAVIDGDLSYDRNHGAAPRCMPG